MLNGDGNKNGNKINRSQLAKNKKQICTCSTLVHIVAVVLHDYNGILHDQHVKLPSYTLFFMEELSYLAHQKFCCLCSCSLLFFSLPLIFTLLAVPYWPLDFSFSQHRYEIFMF